MTQDNRDKFIYIAGRYGQIVKFYNVEKLYNDKINAFFNLMPALLDRLTKVSLYRLLIPNIFSGELNKIIYLDSDIIVNLDISELWKIELDYNPLAAVAHISDENYFNSGVLFINLDILNNVEETLLNGARFIGENPECIFGDQDILNHCFENRWLRLPIKYNKIVQDVRPIGDYDIKNAILHYAGTALNLNMNDAYNRIWFEYFTKTPWFSIDTINHFYDEIKQIHIAQKSFAVQISALMSGKQRAFFVRPNMIDVAKQIFLINTNEELISAESQESLQKLINSLNQSRGQKIFFILSNYPAVAQILMQVGFAEGRDFLNAAMFLSEAHGVSLNTFQLIKSL